MRRRRDEYQILLSSVRILQRWSKIDIVVPPWDYYTRMTAIRQCHNDLCKAIIAAADAIVGCSWIRLICKGYGRWSVMLCKIDATWPDNRKFIAAVMAVEMNMSPHKALIQIEREIKTRAVCR